MPQPEIPLPETALEEFAITLDIEVRWGDMDAFQHVNNTVFFRYFEMTRMQYFVAMGIKPDDVVGPILQATDCRFRRPVTYPDRLRAGACVERVESDRFHMRYELWSSAQQDCVAKGHGTVVAYDYGALSKATVPETWKKAIDDLEAS